MRKDLETSSAQLNIGVLRLRLSIRERMDITPLRMTRKRFLAERSLRCSERIFQRRALRREQFRAIFGDVHVVFQAHPEFARDVDTRLIAEGHASGQRRAVATHQIGPFVTVHADSVSYAVGEEFVVWTKSGVADDFPRRCIHRLTFNTWAGGLERGSLRPKHSLEDLPHLV